MRPTRATIDAWTALVSASRRLLERIEAELKAAGHPPLAWYDVLLEIEKAEPDGLRPFEITDRLLLPQYGTSRLLDRIIKAGLLERQPCVDDARGHVIHITDQGRAIRQAMWPVYAQVLSEEVESRLAPEESLQLARLLEKLRHPPERS